MKRSMTTKEAPVVVVVVVAGFWMVAVDIALAMAETVLVLAVASADGVHPSVGRDGRYDFSLSESYGPNGDEGQTQAQTGLKQSQA